MTRYCDIDDCNNIAEKLSEDAILKLEESFDCFLTYPPKSMCLNCMNWLNSTSKEFKFEDGEVRVDEDRSQTQ